MNKEEDERMSLSSILKKLDIPFYGDIIKMKFIHNDSIIIPDNPQELMHYDICKYIRENSKDKALSKATVSLALSGQRILFCFNLIESTQRRLLYTINVLGYSEQISSDNNFSLQSLFEVKLSNEKDDYWEVKYMIDDAFDKQCANKTDELSDEQRMILKNVVPGINADLYWGKKYFNRKCYFPSLKHFIRAFEHLRSEWLNINDNAKDVYAKLGLYIGTIYMELGQFEKAHYYLDIASNFKASIGGITEFTNCLCNMNDPFALNYIDNTIKRISEIINNSEDGNEHLEGLLDFLFRRMAFTLINHKDYDTAERILKDMIKNERNVDFANNELAYIQKVKEENSSSDEENTSR
jgi:tetratricopeptide (TPR) repeat protein